MGHRNESVASTFRPGGGDDPGLKSSEAAAAGAAGPSARRDVFAGNTHLGFTQTL